VGKESVDGKSTYHYKVTLNADHLKAYCSALVDKLYTTSAIKRVPGVDAENLDKDKASDKQDCNKISIKDAPTYDMWVDAKYKLVYKVRITDSKHTDIYEDVGQVYTGGDDFTLFLKFHDGPQKQDGSISMTGNLKTAKTSGEINVTGGSSADAYTIKATLDARPYAGDIDVSAPAGAIPIQDVLKQFGIDPTTWTSNPSSGGSGPVSTKAHDTERQTDIKAIYGQVEAYYAQNGYYPTLANLNDAAWRKANLKGLDDAALMDPSGTSSAILSAPAAKSYSYTVSGTGGKACNNKTATTQCTKYALTATLEDGSRYTKNSLNE
jgi:hypothetical protein